MPLLTQYDIDRIKAIANERFLELVKDHVPLTQRGKDWFGLCPFHKENTPSFTVSPSKGIYKCFGCGRAGKGGWSFIMAHKGLRPLDAIRYIANHFTIIL